MAEGTKQGNNDLPFHEWSQATACLGYQPALPQTILLALHVKQTTSCLQCQTVDVISHSWFNLYTPHDLQHELCSLQERALLAANVGICSDCGAGLGLSSLEHMQFLFMVQHPEPGAIASALVPPWLTRACCTIIVVTSAPLN